MRFHPRLLDMEYALFQGVAIIAPSRYPTERFPVPLLGQSQPRMVPFFIILEREAFFVCPGEQLESADRLFIVASEQRDCR